MNKMINKKIIETNLEKLIKEGKNTSEIAKIMKITWQGVHYILKRYGFEEFYKEAQIKKEEENKTNKKEEIKNKQILVNLIYQRTLQLAEKESFGARKAIEYMINRNNTNINYLSPTENLSKYRYSYTELKTIFDRYNEAQQKRIKLSLEEIVEGLDIDPMGASRILKKSGLEPMYGTRERSSPTSKEKVVAIKRAYSTDLSYSDIGYFLSIPHYICIQRSKKYRGLKKPIKIWYNTQNNKKGIEVYLSYSLASQIYEAQDLGFNEQETSYLLDTKDFAVEYALEHRNEIEPRLINYLKILYNSPRHNNPYKITIQKI